MTLSENCYELKQLLQIKYELTDKEDYIYVSVNFIYMHICEFRYAHKMYIYGQPKHELIYSKSWN